MIGVSSSALRYKIVITLLIRAALFAKHTTFERSKEGYNCVIAVE
jgi:hypothetical protein